MNLNNFYKEVIIGDVHKLHAPPRNHTMPDGTQISNFNLCPELMIQEGYREWSDAELAAWHAQYDPPLTITDYDNAMENHLDNELTARGYTKRSPIEYTNSSNPRWAQDAADWQAHLDAVMNYGLAVQNAYIAGEPVPTLEEFIAGLPNIVWTVALTEDNANS